ncbi:MAG: hypothetical protein EAX96_09410 [Candidatus Lokiarchaeota archaeon]|nr:hypothetical protein [Candidatus Lokiarchaeota archaeon]
MEMENLNVVLYNVHSSQKIKEITKLLIGFDLNSIIIARALGSAAQEGVPDANKLAIKNDKNILYLKDLPDVMDIIKPSKVYVFAPKPYGKNEFNPSEIIQELKNNEKILLIFGGSAPGLSKRELDMGIPTYINTPKDVGTTGTIAIALYEIYSRQKI